MVNQFEGIFLLLNLIK